MSAAHTKGPLQVARAKNGGGDYAVMDANKNIVAECYEDIRELGECAREEALANATLFAASHEMLELLQTWTGDGALQTFEDRERFRKVARAVMDKATGAAS